MASTDVLSQTLSSITAIKLEEISSQRASYENEKATLLDLVDKEPNQVAKVRILLDRIEDLSSMGNLDDSPAIDFGNLRKFMQQAERDPSVSENLLEDWQSELEKELDVQSLRYQYATLYGQLVNEWLCVSGTSAAPASDDSSSQSFEEIGRKEMHEQRATWENYVFSARETDTGAIENYLRKLFTQDKATTAALAVLRTSIQKFETRMAAANQFHAQSLEWVIKGLLRSDLVTDEKRAILKDFLSNEVVLGEVADVLNMRMSSLQKWQWSGPTSVEQRRQLNGRYRFYHDEDLLQLLLLRYIGVQWSVLLRDALIKFKQTLGVWKTTPEIVPLVDWQRREYFLGSKGRRPHPEADQARNTVEAHRSKHFDEEIFLEQLQAEVDDVRAGYDDDSKNVKDTRKSPQAITQSVLHLLVTEIIMKTRLGEEVTVVRSDFKWFGPSLPHSTIFAVLKFLGVSERWRDFFRKAIEAPMQFTSDGPDAPVQTRKRGTPISGPLSDVLGESVLFCLDFAVNRYTNGARLYRLPDDIWLWGSDATCAAGWTTMEKFAKLMGLEFNESKTGSVKIPAKGKSVSSRSASLPKEDVRWGFLKLDAVTGRFLIDQEDVDKHVEELRRQLSACKSIFDWIQAWNIYGVRFFTTNFGRPARCFGLSHVDMMLDTFSHIQSKLFSDNDSVIGSVITKLKEMLTERFDVEDIPEGYLYFPVEWGGLDVKNPFVNLYLVRDDLINCNPDYFMDFFFQNEEASYNQAKVDYQNGTIARQRASSSFPALPGRFGDEFMSFEEYTRYREQTSEELEQVYAMMLQEPPENLPKATNEVANDLGHDWSRMSPYKIWITQLYAPDMISRFGGLRVVAKGLLPTGMVNMFRESRFKWHG